MFYGVSWSVLSLCYFGDWMGSGPPGFPFVWCLSWCYGGDVVGVVEEFGLGWFPIKDAVADLICDWFMFEG